MLNVAEYENILVFGEVEDEELSPMTAQLMGIGKRLAEQRR